MVHLLGLIERGGGYSPFISFCLFAFSWFYRGRSIEFNFHRHLVMHVMSEFVVSYLFFKKFSWF